MGTVVRLFRAVAGDGGDLDVAAFRGLTLAGLPVGRCGCGQRVYGVDSWPVATGRRWWLTVRCDTCGHETATPVDQARPAPSRRRRRAGLRRRRPAVRAAA